MRSWRRGRPVRVGGRWRRCARCETGWDSFRRWETSDRQRGWGTVADSRQSPTLAESMEKIIKAAVERGASDLHIKAGDVFRARINGKLVALTKQRLTPDQTRAIALKLITS